MEKKLFLFGHDGVGWSIDEDKIHTERFIKDLGIPLTKNPFMADIAHFVWWRQLLEIFWIPIRFKKILTVATNQIEIQNPEFINIKKYIDLWIVANKKQYDLFENNKIPCVYQPFYVDEFKFHPIDLTKQEICNQLGIDYREIAGRFLIGSIQRDSLGVDLNKPKWQKNPGLLIDILKSFPVERSKWKLLLAGPRRHWIISECEKNNIPYYFMGILPQKNIDDIHFNNLSSSIVALLYNLIDC